MKKIKYLFAIVAVAFFAGCEDHLDVQPDGSILTEDQVKDVLAKDPAKLQSEVNGLYSIMKAWPATTGSSNFQEDFGMPGIAAKLDHNGQDLVGDVTGYNWFSGEQDLTNRNFTYRAPRVVWNQFYMQMRTANSIISKMDRETEDPVAKNYLGQALAIRAYDYFNLVQLFQFTYVGNQDKPAVPIVTDETTEEELTNNPRATVGEVYELIMDDLNDAITYLSADGVPSRPDVSAVNLAVAYGIRARVNLVMQNWNEAATDAAMALQVSGESSMSMADVAVPNFDDVTVPGIMWGCIITAEDDATKSGICNWTSMCTNLCFGYGGYTTIVGTWKKVNKLLYNEIPESDVRKGWFLNENYQASALTQYEQSGHAAETFFNWFGVPYSPDYGPFWAVMGMEPYTSVKFAPTNKLMTSQENSNDFPLMRASEMELIIAEGKAMGGSFGEGKAALETWVQNNRNPGFVSQASSAQELQDEIWLQRRIEFWGEGLSWFDLMRLEKPAIRYKEVDGSVDTNYGALAIFNIPADAPYRLWPIPQQEIQANDGISDADNNKMGTLPTSLPVPGQEKSAYIDNLLKSTKSAGRIKPAI
ncbi:RagB/SusD family nutrient uptake outer membrane protein [uncultured Draconibacterium sp.]|uniref:RagB/SusD family nutrient uptake outer membrane protein n=1 Tax=uncultured Draconibacterium sp. TaxID=1573823 RepID=UPI00325FFA51